MSELKLPMTPATSTSITVDELMSRLPVAAKIEVQNLIDYAQGMSGKKRITIEQGKQWQIKLFNTLLNLVNKIDEGNRTAIATALLVIEQNKNDAFADINVYRFGEQADFLNKDKRAAFRSLIHVFVTLADRQTRTLMLRQTDLNKCLKSNLITADGRDRLKQFFEPFRK